jgi:outer membrane protein assembly factor BamD
MGRIRCLLSLLATGVAFFSGPSAEAGTLRRGKNEEKIDGKVPAAARLELGQEAEARGDMGDALHLYKYLARHHCQDREAPFALERMGEIYLQRHRFQSAFCQFQKILEKYPNYDHYGRVVDREFETAERMMVGQRNYFLGVVPGFKNREGAIDFFKKIVEQAPYGERAPQALMNIARLGIRLHEPVVTIDALEKIIDGYPHSSLAPDALLLLAQVHRNRVHGPDYDQQATGEAVNCYQQFLVLFPNSPRKNEAETGLQEARELLAASYLHLGDFYYNVRQNSEAASPYYRETLALAAGSEVGNLAHGRLEAIGQGTPGKGPPLEFLWGKSGRQ